MRSNSIYASLTKDSLLAELKMQLYAPANQSKTFIILEGKDDITLLESCFSKDCYLFESYGGKQALEEIVKMFACPQVIGIRDRDYLKTPNERIFFCDYCNAEMMIISNEDSFSSLMLKAVKIDEDFIAIRDTVLNSLLCLSALRKANEEHQWGLSFQKLSISCLLRGKGSIEKQELIEMLNRVNLNNLIDCDRENTVNQEIESIRDNLLAYTNGHDFCEALICYLKKNYSSNKQIGTWGIDDVHILLSIGFRPVDFTQTILYKNLYEYQEKNNLNILSFVGLNRFSQVV